MPSIDLRAKKKYGALFFFPLPLVCAPPFRLLKRPNDLSPRRCQCPCDRHTAEIWRLSLLLFYASTAAQYLRRPLGRRTTQTNDIGRAAPVHPRPRVCVVVCVSPSGYYGEEGTSQILNLKVAVRKGVALTGIVPLVNLGWHGGMGAGGDERERTHRRERERKREKSNDGRRESGPSRSGGAPSLQRTHSLGHSERYAFKNCEQGL